MKTLKQIKEQFTPLNTHDNQDIVDLVEEGLLEENKIHLFERALTIDAELMTEAEKNVLMDVFTKLMNEKRDSFSVFGNIGRDRKFTSDKEAPMIITFRRKSIRTFPDGVKVVLYHSPLLNKFISIPVGPKAADYVGNQSSLGVHLSERNTFGDDAGAAISKIGRAIRNKAEGKRGFWDSLKDQGATKKDTAKVDAENKLKGLGNKTQTSDAGKTPKTGQVKSALEIERDKKNKAAEYIRLKQSHAHAQETNAGREFKVSGRGRMKPEKYYRDALKKKEDEIRAAGDAVPHVPPRRKPTVSSSSVRPPAMAGEEYRMSEGRLWSGVKKLAKSAYNAVKDDDTADDNGDKRYDGKTFTTKDKYEPKGTGKVSIPKRVTDDASNIAAAKRRGSVPIEVNESNFESIRKLAENKIGGITYVKFDDELLTINSRIAKKVIQIYEGLNKTNRKKVEQMLNESIGTFKKVINFAIKQ